VVVLFAAVCGVLMLTSPPPASSEPEVTGTPNYWVTVTPASNVSPMYTSIGQNWTLTFNAQWSYGNQASQPFENGNATIQVTSSTNVKVGEITTNTTSGSFSINFSSSKPQILTFNITKLEAPDGTVYNAALLDTQNALYGLTSGNTTVWYDDFHVSLVESNTDDLGVTWLSVNVTYLLLPEAGLHLPAEPTFSGQTFLPKVAHNVDETINGVHAQETSTPGIYQAEVSTWTPTSYVHVTVSQPSWIPAKTGFSFTHQANASKWQIALIISAAALVCIAVARFLLYKKAGHGLRSGLPFLGGLLLSVGAVVSLYWGLVGLDGSLSGFNWQLLVIFGLLGLVAGLVSAVFSMRKKRQALAIVSAIAPMMLLVVVETSLAGYGLTVPWVTLIAALAVVAIGGGIICNLDNQFREKQEKKKSDAISESLH
jgi:cytochrome c oxidase subunit IV